MLKSCRHNFKIIGVALVGLVLVVVITLLFSWSPYESAAGAAWGQVNIRDLNVRAEIATSSAAHYRGLSGRPELGLHAGMLFVFSQPEARAFVMRDMSFPLDIIFIKQGRIVNIAADALPSDPDRLYLSAGLADQVLEINAGLSAQYGLEPGDEVKINYYEK